jgi:hypothetical protein
LTALGSAGASANDLTLFVSSVPSTSLFMLLAAPAVANVPQPGGSQGVLCLGGMIGRYAPQARPTTALGTGALAVDLAALPQPTGFLAALPGETWTFQAWHRDANPMPTSNFTHAVSVTVQ